MKKFAASKKVDLHLHLEGAADPGFVREIIKDKYKRLLDIFDKLGNYRRSSFEEFIKVYETVTKYFFDEKSFKKILRHIPVGQLKSNIIYLEVFLGPHLRGDKFCEKWFNFLGIAKNVSDEFEKTSHIYKIHNLKIKKQLIKR